ncbi:hypothetical protein PENTCL1PPCAC_1620, partial [Pristionchus entomophagus]
TRGSYKRVKGKSSQRCRRFPSVLPEDNNREIYQNKKKCQLWFFILHLLADPTKKSIIIWTGNQRQFRIRDMKMFCHLWSKHIEMSSDVQWASVCRTLRNCAGKEILMAVPHQEHRGKNEEGVFGFVIEPSFYLNMSREGLDHTISLHCETGPLTVGSPVDSSFGYSVGTRLQVVPIMELDSEGNLIHPIPDHFITVLPSSKNEKSAHMQP